LKGGAAGIGFGIVKYLAQARDQKVSHIAILDINPVIGNQAVKLLEHEFPNVTFSFHLCDVTSWENQAQTLEAIHGRQGRIDIVCANAGISETGSLFTTTGDKPVKPDLKTYDVDLTGTMYSMDTCPSF
jgi:NAD(P)-dependent dehydrogenase (short-subunit alcohol dehydrogenase family)